MFLLLFQQNCNFKKHDSNSALHVAYAGALRVTALVVDAVLDGILRSTVTTAVDL